MTRISAARWSIPLLTALVVATSGLGTAGAATPVSAVTAAPAKGSGQFIAAFTLVAPASVSPSQLVARAIVRGGSCPQLKVVKTSGAKQSLTMPVRQRPANTGQYFSSVKVCSRNLPTTAKSATIGGRAVPAVLATNIKRMALFADTGCRINQIKGNYEVQNCDQPTNPTKGWPLNQVARSIAAEKPDVILNPGDYFYREANCPTAKFAWAQAACGGSPPIPAAGYPFKDSAAGWLADVFTPMAPIFPVAPIAMLRGNHESCDRAGNGFFYFLDPRPNSSGTCAPRSVGGVLTARLPATTPTWSATLDLIKGRTLKLAMVDSAYGNDGTITQWAQTQRATYRAAAQQTKPSSGQESWLLTHRPIIGHARRWLAADQTAAAKGLLGNYNLVLSSHIHLVQGIRIPGLPPSLVMGNGGTLLDRNPGPMSKPLVSGTTTYPMPTTDWSASQWGYAIASAGSTSRTWTITHKTQAGATFARCNLRQRAMTCS